MSLDRPCHHTGIPFELLLNYSLDILVTAGGRTSFATFFLFFPTTLGRNVTLSVGYAPGSSSTQSGLNVNVSRDVLKKKALFCLFHLIFCLLPLFPFTWLTPFPSPLLSYFLCSLGYFSPPPASHPLRPHSILFWHSVSLAVIYCPSFYLIPLVSLFLSFVLYLNPYLYLVKPLCLCLSLPFPFCCSLSVSLAQASVSGLPVICLSITCRAYSFLPT